MGSAADDAEFTAVLGLARDVEVASERIDAGLRRWAVGAAKDAPAAAASAAAAAASASAAPAAAAKGRGGGVPPRTGMRRGAVRRGDASITHGEYGEMSQLLEELKVSDPPDEAVHNRYAFLVGEESLAGEES